MGVSFVFGGIVTILVLFGIVYAAGFHPPGDIISGTFQGNYIFNGNINVTQGQLINQKASLLAPSGTNQTINWNTGNSQEIDLENATGNVTLTFINPVSGGSYLIKIIQGGNSTELIWPASVKWIGATNFTLSSTNNTIDLVSLFYDGNNYLGSGGNDFQ